MLWGLCGLFFIASASARIWRDNIDRSVTGLFKSTKFEARVRYKVCLLKPQEGPCRSKITMYYFDPSIMACARFDWGGCQGNGNRFDTEEECLSYCRTKEGYKPPRPKWCQLGFDYGTCFGDIDKYYFDQFWQVCKPAKYSGCGGNKNNFNSRIQCESICLHGKGISNYGQDGKKNRGYNTVLVVDPMVTPSRKNQISTVTRKMTTEMDPKNMTQESGSSCQPKRSTSADEKELPQELIGKGYKKYSDAFTMFYTASDKYMKYQYNP